VLKVENGSKYIVYSERMSKNKQFGLKNAHIEQKRSEILYHSTNKQVIEETKAGECDQKIHYHIIKIKNRTTIKR